MTERNIVSEYMQLADVTSVEDFSGLIPHINGLERYSFEPTEANIIHDLADRDEHDTDHDRSHIESPENSLSIASANSFSESLATGNINLEQIATGRDNDFILGIANADALSEATAIANAKPLSDGAVSAEADSLAIASSLAVATGIDNSGNIATNKGNDIIFGLAIANASSAAKARSKAKSTSDSSLTAIANSESVAESIAGAAGINNSGKIDTGKGHDVIIGLASTSTSSEGIAKAKAILENHTVDDVTELADTQIGAIAEGTSIAVAIGQTQALGINNTGEILTGQGNDLILGLANAESLSDVRARSQARLVTENPGAAEADANGNALAIGDAVGIVNSGKIATGKGNDTILGIAVNNPTAEANADALADVVAEESSSDTNTFTVADNSATIAIGINNSGGKIDTGKGNDRVISHSSAIGILGGEIDTGKGDDLVIGYGGDVGIADSIIRTGTGDDYVNATKIDLDPLTGNFTLSEDRAGSIRNTEIYGDSGHDTFKIGGFEENVLIDGGRDFDVLKLWGNIDDYQITLGSDSQTLTIEDAGSVLTAKNVEEIYFERDRYTPTDFA